MHHNFVSFFITQANMHESISIEQGYITFRHRWLIVTEERTLSLVQKYVVNITHTTAVTYSQLQTMVCMENEIVVNAMDHT